MSPHALLKSKQTALTLSLTLSLTSSVSACFWDRDTLAQERKAQPKVLDLLSGRFVHRSQVVYERRAQSRPQQLREKGLGWLLEALHQEPDEDLSKAHPPLTPQQLALTDDLAVALDKLGHHGEASALMRRVLALHPARYETLANLGTTLIHDGQLKEGLSALERALEVNPNAHFGRERVQVALVQYIIAQRALSAQSEEGSVWPLSQECVGRFPPLLADPWLKDLPDASWGGRLHRPRAHSRGSKDTRYVEPAGEGQLCLVMPQQRSSKPHPHDLKGSCRGFCGMLKAQGISTKEGLKGVLGMMRFSDHTHPALLEALGDLLLEKGYRSQNQLAAMAYLQASRSSVLANQPQARQRYESLAALSLVGHRFGLKELSDQLAPQLKRGERFRARLERDERAWLRRGERFLERSYRARYLRRKLK